MKRRVQTNLGNKYEQNFVSTPQDEELMLDEDANSADRSTAAECLASDGFGKQIHPILDSMA